MTPEEWSRVRSAFEELEACDPPVRAARLAELRATGPELADQVARLLAANDSVEDCFLEPPVPLDLAAHEAHGARDAVASTGRRVGSFVLGEVLAAGGMGTVYRASQADPRREVAVKMLSTGLASERSRRRFRYESELLARLRHPGIAQVYEAGFVDEGGRATPWFAMELVEDARTITSFADARDLSWRARVRLMLQVCDAVHHGHQRGVVHRDLKPGNLLVDGGGHVKVIDFGVARGLDEDAELTREGELVGTLASMSPEQIDGRPEDLDARTDVYSLGVVLYRLLAGEAPYDVTGLSLGEAARVIREDDPPRLAARGLPEDLDWIVLRAMEKDPARRYPSASELGADLARFLDDEPVVAGPPTATYRLRKFYDRHRFGTLAAGVALLALVLGLVGTGLGWSRAVAAEARATRDLRRAVDAEGRALVNLERAREAEARARADRAEALDQAALSGEVVGFVLDGLSSPDPGDVGRDLTMLEFLERRAPEMQERFAARPNVRGRLELVVGRAFVGLGNPAEAEPLLAAAVETFEGLGAPAHDELRAALLDLGVLRTEQGRFDEARELLERALALAPLDGDGPDAAPRHWSAQSRMARLLLRRGEREEARALLERVVAALDGVDGFERELGDARSFLAGSMQELGEGDAAREEYRRALAEKLAKEGEDHPDVLRLRGNLAMLEHEAGNSERAVELLEALVAGQVRVLGPKHRDTVVAKANLAGLLFLLDRIDEAVPLWREAVEVLALELEPEHPLLQTLHVNLGVCALNEGDLDEAEDLLVPVYDLRLERFGEGDERTLKLEYELAKLEVAREEWDDAFDRLRRVLATVREVEGEGSPRFARLLTVELDAHLMLEDAASARPVLEDLEAGLAGGRYSGRDLVAGELEGYRARLAALE